MKLWSDWLPDVLPYVDRCPRLIAMHAIKRAAQRLFEESNAWIVRSATMPVVSGQSDVTVDLGDATLALVEIEAAFYDGTQIYPKTPRELMDANGSDWAAMVGTPRAFVHRRRGALQLWPTPDADATTGLVLDAAVMPAESSTGVPDDQFLAYRDSIAIGARSILMLMPNKPWSSPKMGATLASQFDGEVNGTTAYSALGHGRGQGRPRVRWF